MKRLLVLTILLLHTLFADASYIDDDNRLLLDTLRSSLAALEDVHRHVNNQFNELKIRRAQSAGHERVVLGEEIGRSYMMQDVDSALCYLNAARQDAITVKDHEAEMRTRMQIYALLPVTGATREAVDLYENIDYEQLPESLRSEYWRTGAELYHAAQIPYPEGGFKEYYRHRCLVAIDSMLSYYTDDSTLRDYIKGHSFLMRGDVNLAVANFADVIPRLTDHPELADFALNMIVQYYHGRPQYDHVYLNYLIKRTIRLLDRGLVRPDLLAQMGEELMNRGYADLGRRCISLALETSDRSCMGPYRSFDRAKYAHYLVGEAASMRTTRIVFICVVVLVVIAGAFVIASQRIALRKAREANVEAIARYDSAIREAQLTNQSLITLAFVALDQLKEYGLHVARKLKAGQMKDLVAETDSGKYLQQQTEKYFEVFDSTFLSNFPHFVTRLNELLHPDRQLSLLPGDRLSPELRIAAFMRLGVNDSTRLSQALGLSLNTIYTYRNRLKGRAIDRETFEENVKKLV